jgi:hypothetical protein
MKFYFVSSTRRLYYTRLTAIGLDVVRINNEVNLRARDMVKDEDYLGLLRLCVSSAICTDGCHIHDIVSETIHPARTVSCLISTTRNASKESQNGSAGSSEPRMSDPITRRVLVNPNSDMHYVDPPLKLVPIRKHVCTDCTASASGI